MAQARGCGLLAFNGKVSSLLLEERMSENGGHRSALPPVVTMNWCSTCATPLPSEWTVCPGCELYGTAVEALDDCDSARAAARLLERDSRLTMMAEAGIALSMGVTEAVSEFRLRREVIGRSMNDLQSRVHANARNRRRNRGVNDGMSASVRVGTRSQHRDATPSSTSTPHPPLPSGWAMVWCPQGRPYYWNYAEGSAQWELPPEVQAREPCASAPCDRNEEANAESDLEARPPAQAASGPGWSTSSSLRIRFASTHGMAQVAQAFPTAWEPEPTPRERESDDGPSQV